MERCKLTNSRLQSRCVLEDGHSGKHQIPNHILKLERRDLFDRLQGEEIPDEKILKQLKRLEQTGKG